MKPNFFIVGAPKCGTTSLFASLRKHPEVLMSKIKEPHYFAKDLKISKYKNIDEYESLFNRCPKNNIKAIGEASASYLFSSVALKEIRNYNPNAKIIACIRNPVEFLYSFHNQMLRAGVENVESFEKAWNLQHARKNGRFIPWSCKSPIYLQYREWARFSKQLKRMFSIFPKKQIKIILLDQFTDNKYLMNEVENFLNITQTDQKFIVKTNISNNVKSVLYQQILIFITDVVSSIKKKLDINIKFGIYTFFFKKNLTHKKNSFVVDTKIRDELLIEITNIENLLNIDLSPWKV